MAETPWLNTITFIRRHNITMEISFSLSISFSLCLPLSVCLSRSLPLCFSLFSLSRSCLCLCLWPVYIYLFLLFWPWVILKTPFRVLSPRILTQETQNSQYKQLDQDNLQSRQRRLNTGNTKPRGAENTTYTGIYIASQWRKWHY